MKLSEAKRQVEHEHPDLVGNKKIAAIKELRDLDRPERTPLREDKPARFWLAAVAAIAASFPFYFLGVHGIWLTGVAIVTARLIWWWTGR